MSKYVQEQMEYLNELIRKVHKIVFPEHAEDLKWLLNKDLMHQMREKYPKCFVSTTDTRNNPVFLPICSRMAVVDPKMIDISIDIVKRLEHKQKISPDYARPVLMRLKKLKTRYDKESPTSPKQAATKAKLTSFIKSLEKNRSKNDKG